MIDHFRFDKGGISRKPSRYYLAYGSNLDMERMGHRCPYAVPVGVTEIYGYRLLFKKSKTGCYATIEQDVCHAGFQLLHPMPIQIPDGKLELLLVIVPRAALIPIQQQFIKLGKQPYHS